jgi:hypothetical protein
MHIFSFSDFCYDILCCRHFIVYDNGIEGIKDSNFRTPGGVARLIPPVPDQSAESGFHYQPFDPEAHYETEPGYCCPILRLNKIIAHCGDVFILSEEREWGDHYDG